MWYFENNRQPASRPMPVKDMQMPKQAEQPEQPKRAIPSEQSSWSSDLTLNEAIEKDFEDVKPGAFQ